MCNHIYLALLAGLGTWFVTALGAGVVVFFRSPSNKVLNLMMGFAAGVMIAASFWSLLDPAIERANATSSIPAYVVVTMGFLLGAVFMWGADKMVSLYHHKEEPQKWIKKGKNRSMMLLLSITLHNIPEGLAVGVAFGALQQGYSKEALLGAITIAVGIGLQNFPAGAAVSLPLMREGCSRRRSFLTGQASAMVEPIASLMGALLVVYVETFLPYALAFAAGAMILVAVHELIPECQSQQGEQPYFATMGIVLDFACMMFLDVALG